MMNKIYRLGKYLMPGKIILLLVLIIAQAITACNRSNPSRTEEPVVIDAADYGAVPDDGRDDTPAVQAALDQIRTISKKAVLSFDQGEYDFFPATASKAHYPVTAVHKQWDFITPFHLDGLKELTIDGGGSLFRMHGRMTPFVLNACQNIRIMRLSVEHERPSVFELEVCTKDNREIEFEAIAGDQFIIEENRVIWLDGDDNRQIPDVCQYYDPVMDITRRCPDPMKDATSITRTGKNRITVTFEVGSVLPVAVEPGMVFQYRYGIRNQSGVVVYECQQVAFEEMDIYSWNGLGFVCQFCQDLTFSNLRMEPNPDSHRTNAGFADAIQVLAGRGEILIENSRFAGLHDDHINIYGQMMKVTRVDSLSTIEAVFTSNETEGYLNFRKGDSLVLRNPNTLEVERKFQVTGASLLDDQTMRILLDGDVPAGHEGYWIENLTWIPEKVTIRGNYFGRVPTRSILMYVSRESIIENNTFHRIPMTTILMKCPDQHYALQNHTGKLTVRNNTFYECESALIQSNPQVSPLSPDADLYGTLEVRDNLVIMREKRSRLLDIRGFSQVNLGGNRIEVSEPHHEMARFSDCKEVNLSPQMILGVTEYIPEAEMERVNEFSATGWEVLKKTF